MDSRRRQYLIQQLGYVCGNVHVDYLADWVEKPEDGYCEHGVLFSEPCEECGDA